MRRLAALAPVVALLVAACGSGDPGAGSPSTTTTTIPAEPATTVSPSPDSTAAADTTTTTAASTPTTSDRPLAPDFTLALGDGGSFTLSEEQKPVYMVFWAEW